MEPIQRFNSGKQLFIVTFIKYKTEAAFYMN